MASTVQALPQFFALKSETNNRYLRFIHQDIDGVHGILQFSGEEVVSPYTKFQVEEATINNGDRRLVHIRSCYNNKYLRRADQNSRWIVAGADEPQENQTLWSCTLFEPELPTDNNGSSIRIGLNHVQLGHIQATNDFQANLFANPDSLNLDVYTVINWNSLVILPKNVAFIGDNNKYLAVEVIEGVPYLRFSGTVPTDISVHYEIAPYKDGNILIKSNSQQKYWIENDNAWILANSEYVVANDRLFNPVPIDADTNVIALLSHQKNNYCRRNPSDRIDCLKASLPYITSEAYLTVHELVQSRTISDLIFHLADARIYNHNSEHVLATGNFENNTLQPACTTIRLSYKDTKDSTWKTIVDNVAFTSFTHTTLNSDTPFVLEGGRIGPSGKFNGAYQWGKTHTSETPIVRRFLVVVQPRRRVTVKLLATKASCDIPFYYSQQDTLIRQHQPIITYHKEGGVYTGVSFSNFRYTQEEEPLEESA